MEYRELGIPTQFPYVDLRPAPSMHTGTLVDPVDPDAARLVPELSARRHGMLPFAFTAEAIDVAVSLPLDDEAQQFLEQLGRPLRFFRASPVQLRAALRRVWDPHSPDSPWSESSRQDQVAPRQLSDILLDAGMISVGDLNRALQKQAQTQGWLGSILINTNSVSPLSVARAVAAQHNRPLVDLLTSEDGRQGLRTLDPALFATMPASFWRDNLMVPLSRREQRLIVAVTNLDGDSEAPLGELERATGLHVRPMITGYRDVVAALHTIYGQEFVRDSREGLRDRRPEDSASFRFSARQIAAGALLAVGTVAGLVLQPLAVLVGLNAIAQFFYLGLTIGKLSLLLRLRKVHPGIDIPPEEIAQIDQAGLPVYTVLVPAYKETRVLPILAKALSELEYPHDRLDIKLLLEADDTQMIETARALRLPNFIDIVTVPVSEPRTKPKACNYGLHLARGEYTVIFDAEDIPETDQLLKAIAAFRQVGPEVACIQAKLAYYNRHENLLTRWFTSEYLMWFDLMLPALHALHLPIPLGGTSNHFRTSVLREVDAWDPFNVAEDADLGIRLHKAGYRTLILDATTYEEANTRLGNWIRQRSRWVKGYMQTWIVHMRHPIALWRSMGPRGFLWFHAVIGGTAATLVLNPLYMVLTTLWYLTYQGALHAPFPGWVYWIAAANLFLGNFAFTYANMVAVVRRNVWDLVICTILSPFYWMLMSIAAWKALIQLITRPSYWEKTDHGLTNALPAAGAAPAAGDGGVGSASTGLPPPAGTTPPPTAGTRGRARRARPRSVAFVAAMAMGWVAFAGVLYHDHFQRHLVPRAVLSSPTSAVPSATPPNGTATHVVVALATTSSSRTPKLTTVTHVPLPTKPIATAGVASLPSQIGPGIWLATAAMHKARSAQQAVKLKDGRVLIVGGYGASGPMADAELYDPRKGRWTTTGSMPRTYFSATLHLWQQYRGKPSSMRSPRTYFSATVLRDGRVLVAGGDDAESTLDTAELYDPKTGVWTATGSMHIPRDQHTATLLLNGMVLVAGGETMGTVPIASAELYNPATGQWTPTSSMLAAHWDATATRLPNGRVLVAGGGGASAELYNPATGRWTATGSMARKRYRHTATLLRNNKVLVVGGETAFTAPLDTAELYDPRTGKWTSAGKMAAIHSRHTATLLDNGLVLVTGGATGRDTQVSLETGTTKAELYNPATNTWLPAGRMHSNRGEQTATLLDNGLVLLAGGYTAQGAVTARAELYKPATGMHTGLVGAALAHPSTVTQFDAGGSPKEFYRVAKNDQCHARGLGTSHFSETSQPDAPVAPVLEKALLRMGVLGC